MFFSKFFKQIPRYFVPEVVQTSAMDCGPASLKAMLEGFGINASYGRLREACQTDVDGTCIDTLEDIAVQLGLDAEQILVPVEHLFLSDSKSLPGLVVIKLPNGLTHFTVAWRIHHKWVQVMDPSKGRRWVSKKRFQKDVYIHKHTFSASAWRQYAGSPAFCDPLKQRLINAGCSLRGSAKLIETALNDKTWHSLAKLDASIRMVEILIHSKGLPIDGDIEKIVNKFFTINENDESKTFTLPMTCWSVRPLSTDEKEEQLIVKGAVILRVKKPLTEEHSSASSTSTDNGKSKDLPPKLKAILDEKPINPGWEFIKYLKMDGVLSYALLLPSIALSALGTILEIALFMGLLKLTETLNAPILRFEAAVAFVLFVFSLLVLELFMTNTVTRIGRRLEIRLRTAFLEKIPNLNDRYFHSRLTSDMAQRAFEMKELRKLPHVGFDFIRIFFRIILTTIGIIWLDPSSAFIALLATATSMGLATIFHPILVEMDMRLLTHNAGMSRFYLDSLIGLIPIRSHGASRPVRSEHENLLVEWVRTSYEFLSSRIFIQFSQACVGASFAIWILFQYVIKGGEPAGVLLLFYWALSLPSLGQMLATLAQQYPMFRNRLMRVLEPLGSPDEVEINAQHDNKQSEKIGIQNDEGVDISFDKVQVQAGGHTILNNISLNIKKGEHIAIIGPSGAGKSSIASMLLGWHNPSQGEIKINDITFGGKHMPELREKTAWIDPAIQVWNRSLFENLTYGNETTEQDGISQAIQEADLYDILERLPNGLQTNLGEGGGLVSGGEGQRIRLGRAILKQHTSLVILDEPFRGLDRQTRTTLLGHVRNKWKNATLIFISHDIEDTHDFQRIIVVENGEIAEEGKPRNLLKRKTSRYRDFLQAEKAVRSKFWESKKWQQFHLSEGKISTLN